MAAERHRVIADRVRRLGTETAFAVSAEAAEWAGRGHKVYPFHLGDLDLPTPANVVAAAERAIADGKTGYCPNAGIPALREALAADVGASHGLELAPANVVIEPGGKPVIGKFILALMNPGDGVLYPNPGYPIYESQIEFNGGIALPYGYVEGAENFELDFEALERQVTPSTRLLIFNNLQNPTGAESSAAELERMAEFALRHDLTVLSDEAYWDMRYSGISRSIASLPGMAERTVVLYTFSKKFAMTGWRLGAAIGPTEIAEVIAKLNVNDESCSNHFVQYGALEGLRGDQSGPREIVRVLKERRDVCVDLLNEIPGVRCFRPEATFYLFPNVTGLMERKGLTTYDELRRAALEQTGVSFCTRLHFGRALPGEAEAYARFAYSGIPVAEIREGLGKLKEWART
ncbi:MAG TPA: aminotransferase class I/II-fold pyridoxal phosphate-dependent enzyme [Thermoleophilia bacterium]|nr:aminotransferase class I/II-fold pyridoxal phosphate-dependent enzyme [Thermoleophilia bacterium]